MTDETLKEAYELHQKKRVYELEIEDLTKVNAYTENGLGFDIKVNIGHSEHVYTLTPDMAQQLVDLLTLGYQEELEKVKKQFENL